MWEPGTKNPSSSKKKKRKNGKKESMPKLDLSISNDDGLRGETAGTTVPSTATPRKRLSGGTMNMRFMKRRKDTNNDNGNAGTEKHIQYSRAKTSSDVRMEKNDHVSIEGDNRISTEKDNKSNYSQASSVDIYGVEGSMVGRRSFRGFNQPMERIWKDSKESLEKRRATDRSGGKITDEELILRYQGTSKQRTKIK